MQAFPVGSANNALGGSGPVNKQIDLDIYHGRAAQGFTDYNETMQIPTNGNEYLNSRRPQVDDRTQAFNAKENIEPVHGEATAGLGSTTFMEGTPASRAALQRRESETADDGTQPSGGFGGLSRKRSIAQKFRGMSRGRPGMSEAGRVKSPEARYVTSPGPQSAGGRVGAVQELNPFFNEPQPPQDKKGVNVTTVPTNGASSSAGLARQRSRTNSSPHRRFAMGRKSDEWGTGESGDKANGGGGGSGGILGRVKSLRGKRVRPERIGTAS